MLRTYKVIQRTGKLTQGWQKEKEKPTLRKVPDI